jgi:hypothetical protein
LLPAVSQKYGVTFDRSRKTRHHKASSGAAAAFTMAWYHPERYHKLCLFRHLREPGLAAGSKTPRGAWEYHDHLIAQAPKKPIRMDGSGRQGQSVR